MSYYEWVCKECVHFWEEEHPIGTAPSKQNCPTCEVLCERKWDTPPAVHYKGAGWHAKGGYHLHGSSDEVNKKLQGESEDRMAGGWKNYAKYDPGEGYIKAAGGRRLNDVELGQKLDAAKKTSDHVYNNAGINPHNKYKGQ